MWSLLYSQPQHSIWHVVDGESMNELIRDEWDVPFSPCPKTTVELQGQHGSVPLLWFLRTPCPDVWRRTCNPLLWLSMYLSCWWWWLQSPAQCETLAEGENDHESYHLGRIPRPQAQREFTGFVIWVVLGDAAADADDMHWAHVMCTLYASRYCPSPEPKFFPSTLCYLSLGGRNPTCSEKASLDWFKNRLFGELPLHLPQDVGTGLTSSSSTVPPAFQGPVSDLKPLSLPN